MSKNSFPFSSGAHLREQGQASLEQHARAALEQNPHAIFSHLCLRTENEDHYAVALDMLSNIAEITLDTKHGDHAQKQQIAFAELIEPLIWEDPDTGQTQYVSFIEVTPPKPDKYPKTAFQMLVSSDITLADPVLYAVPDGNGYVYRFQAKSARNIIAAKL